MTHRAHPHCSAPSPPGLGRSYTGAVLAGGRSRRMGVPKEGVLLWDGRPMIEHVLASLLGLCHRVVIVGDCRGYTDAGCGIVRLPDLHPGAGPLAGIQALLASDLDSGYLVVACDQPFLTPRLIRRLLPADPHEPRFFRDSAGGLQPLPGHFPAAWLPRVEDAIHHGRLSLRDVIGPAELSWPALSDDEMMLLRSVNTPDDLPASPTELVGAER